MKNFIQPGDTLTFTAAAPAFGGTLIQFGEIFGVVCGDAATGQKVDVATRGVFELNKVAGDVISVGEAVYADFDGNDVGEADSAHLVMIGHAVEAAGNGATTVKVKLA